jgi:hypothetical protein
MSHMRRRSFITLLGGAAAGWPWTAQAQRAEPLRRLGVLMNLSEEDAEGQARVAAFRDGLQKLGWIEGRNYPDRVSLGGWRSATHTRLRGRAGVMEAGLDEEDRVRNEENTVGPFADDHLEGAIKLGGCAHLQRFDLE